MTFHSVLFGAYLNGAGAEAREAPACFGDLQLDRIVEAITAGRQDYALQTFFHAPLGNKEAILFRQAVFRDLEQPAAAAAVEAFAGAMQAMRDCLAQADKLRYPMQQQRWFVEAVRAYCDGVRALAHDLAGAGLESSGLRAIRDDVNAYAHGAAYRALVDETQAVLAGLETVRYTLHIRGLSVTVRAYAGEADYGAEVAATFAKFQQGAVKDYTAQISDWPDMNHVEAGVLERVARLFPEVFGRLEAYCAAHAGYLEPGIRAFDREVQFYLAYLEYMAGFRRAGLPFCYPEVTATDKTVSSEGGFDAALARQLIAEGQPVVVNDFALRGAERLLVVTGPNQGGKTTFARAFGQLHYLACLGCPVPGRAARLFVFDRLLTHFEREETIENLRGKLQDDLARMRGVLEQATPNSLIILNEIFTATTVSDALFLSRRILEQILELDALGVCVTFLDELAALSVKTVSMVGSVEPDNPAQRTFRFVRRPADGLAYALAIAEKYRLTYADLQERLPT